MSKFSRRIVCALTIAVFATALTGGTYAATAAPTDQSQQGLEPDPNFEKPTIGECRNYGMPAVAGASNSSPVVPCSTTHTSKVIATPMLPASLTWETATENALRRAVAKACYPAFRSILGRTESLRHKSAYEYAWFIPTLAQREQGARWMRCDLILVGGLTLQPITRNTAPILQAAPLPRSVTSCLSGDPVRKTVCSKSHRYRATGTWLVDRTTYPGNAALRDIAQRRCPSLVSTPRNWYAFWMSRASWLAGDHTIVCYSHTTN